MTDFAFEHYDGALEAPTDAYSVRFYRNQVDDLDHVEIRYPGDKLNAPDFKAEDMHKLRWPEQWKAYEEGSDQFEGQTIIEDVPWIDPALHEHLRSLGIPTLEMLAAATDLNIGTIGMGGRKMRDRAKDEVEAKQKAAGFDGQQVEIDALKARLAALEGGAKPAGKGATAQAGA